MSFGDIGNGASRSVVGISNPGPSLSRASSGSNSLSQLSDSLRLFQRSCQGIKDKTTDMRRRGSVGPTEKNDLETQIRELREMEQKIKMQLDTEVRQLENLPRNEIASKRASLAKLQKDFDRIKVALPGVISDASLIKVDRGMVGTGSSKSNNGSGFMRVTSSSQKGIPTPPGQGGRQQQQLQQMPKVPVLIEQDIDEMIIEERNRDIQKLNSDLIKVNEIFRELAPIIDSQGELINTVHQATHESHEEAKKGLDQVEQASKLQPGCSIC